MKSAPAWIFFANLCGRHSYGGTNGLEAAPKNKRGGVVMGRPLRSTPSSRMIFAVRSSCIESKSKTRLACGWSPTVTSSPVKHKTLETPMAAAPSKSPCMAMRLRSRQETCRTGLYPALVNKAQMATLDIWQLAPEASVALIASQTSDKTNAAS